MRDIKFRGKRKENGEWVEGCFSLGGGMPYDRNRVFVEPSCLLFTRVEVIPETVGQYTGLKDKNGKEIYEGDIVRTRHFTGGNFCDFILNDGVIDWHKGSWRHNREHKKCGWQYLWTCIDYSYELEVIGNIYENPELLEVQK